MPELKPASNKNTLYVVEDDPIQRDLFVSINTNQSYSIESFDHGVGFLDSITTDNFGVILLDIGLPDISGLQVLEELSKRNIKMPTIVLSSHANFEVCREAFRNGAVDFLTKDIDPVLMKHVILMHMKNETFRRNMWLRNATTKRLLQSLTDRERDVLGYLLSGYSSKKVAQELGISPRTAEVHRGNIMRKFDVESFNQIFQLLSNIQSKVGSSVKFVDVNAVSADIS